MSNYLRRFLVVGDVVLLDVIDVLDDHLPDAPCAYSSLPNHLLRSRPCSAALFLRSATRLDPAL